MKTIAIAGLALVACFWLSSCGTTSCQDICEGCGAYDEEKCVAECLDNYMDGDSACKEAIRDHADCVDDKSCGECFVVRLDVLNHC